MKHFTDKIDKQPNGCWFWTGKEKEGRRRSCPSRIQIDGIEMSGRAAFYSYYIAPVPKDKRVEVNCGNSMCVNPDHLKLVDLFHRNHKDLVGQTFGKLLVESQYRTNNRSGISIYRCVCKCICGEQRDVLFQELRNGKVRCCGCSKPLATAFKKGMEEKKLSLQELIKKKTIVDQNGCWMWTGYKPTPYGAQRINGKVWIAHRLSYTVFKGDIPEGYFVCHKCDVPGCCNPEHLFLGTPQDNMVDMINKGRQRKPGLTILTPQEMATIKQEISSRGNLALRQVAFQLGYSPTLIYNINKGRRKYATG